MLKWLFGQKEPAGKLLSLLSLWHLFETVELNRPELAEKLDNFALQLERQLEESKAVVNKRAETGTFADIDFIFDVLSRLPAPGGKLSAGEKGFSLDRIEWERAEADLGVVGKVVNGIRVAVQGRKVAPYERRILELRRRLAELSSRRKRKDEIEKEAAVIAEELKAEEERLREEVNSIDQSFREILRRMLLLYEFYEHCLSALAKVNSAEGLNRVIERLRSGTPAERVIALKVLLRAKWQAKTISEGLDFDIARMKLSESETERRQAEKELERLIQRTSDPKELKEVVEPRLAEEGLSKLQALTLKRLAEVEPKIALKRFAEVISHPDEPEELKTAVVEATATKLIFNVPEPGVELLVRAMDDLAMEVRVSAARALSRLPENTTEQARVAAMNRLIFALRDGDWQVREAAAQALNPKCYPQASILLAQVLLTETNPNAREFAAKSLGWNFSPNPETTAALVKVLKDEDAAVRKASAEALVAQKQIPTEPEERLHFFCAKQDWNALVNAGPAALVCLLPRLKDQREEIRLNVVRTLGKIGAREAVKHLCIALSDAAQEVRKAAARALAEIGDPEAVSALKSASAKEGFKEVQVEMERAIKRLS